jgi:hypothetical protein
VAVDCKEYRTRNLATAQPWGQEKQFPTPFLKVKLLYTILNFFFFFFETNEGDLIANRKKAEYKAPTNCGHCRKKEKKKEKKKEREREEKNKNKN